MYLYERIWWNYIGEGFLAWRGAVIALPWVDVAIQICHAPASSRETVAILPPRVVRFCRVYTKTARVWNSVRGNYLGWTGIKVGVKLLYPDLKQDIWKRGTQMLRLKSLKWGSGLLAPQEPDRAPWWALAMGMALWAGQGHPVPVRTWSLATNTHLFQLIKPSCEERGI